MFFDHLLRGLKSQILKNKERRRKKQADKILKNLHLLAAKYSELQAQIALAAEESNLAEFFRLRDNLDDVKSDLSYLVNKARGTEISDLEIKGILEKNIQFLSD